MSIDTTSSASPISESMAEQYDSADWAQHDPAVEELYGGQWVVAVDRKIVAHGADPGLVLKAAAVITGKNPDELIVCGIPHPDDWLVDA